MTATIGDAIRRATERLEKAGIEDAGTDARLLVGMATGLDRTGLVVGRDQRLATDETARLDAVLARRMKREPVSRILGQREFWSLPFALGPDVLDPRPDSETLVAEALARLPEADRDYRLLDLGTGTGCLLLALLFERPNGWGVGVDRAERAASVARANAVSLGLADRACFMVGHWGDALQTRFDLIVCNPPYISLAERAALAQEVRDHDPALALFGGDDGLDAYRAIGPRLGALLAEDGVAVVEICAGQTEAVTGLMANNALETVAIRSDLAGYDRALAIKALNPVK